MSLRIGNVDVHCKDVGIGQPVLLLHGNPDSSDLWDGVITALAPYYRCIAPDLPGFGRSVAPEDFDCSLDNMARFVDDLVETLGIAEPLNLIVHDFGGPYGLAWAVTHPQKVNRLVVFNTLFFADYRWHVFGRLWRTPLIGELSLALMPKWFATWAMRRGSPGLSDEHLDHVYRLSFAKASVNRMIVRLYRATDPENFAGWEEKRLALTAKVPCCVLWGDQDPYIPARFADRFGAQQVVHFPNYGHWLPVEATEEVSRYLLDFLAKNTRIVP